MVPPPEDVEGLGAYGKAVANGIAYDAAGRQPAGYTPAVLILHEVRDSGSTSIHS